MTSAAPIIENHHPGTVSKPTRALRPTSGRTWRVRHAQTSSEAPSAGRRVDSGAPVGPEKSAEPKGRLSRRRRRLELDALDDLSLLGRVLQNDEIAWASFYDRFRSLMIACVTRVCVRSGVRLQSSDLLDVLSDISINMVAHNFRRLRLYREDGGCSVSSWIGVIASSTTHDFLRRERRLRMDAVANTELERLAPVVEGPDQGLIDREQRVFVNEALNGLSRRDRMFVRLYFGEARAPEEVAQEMGVSISTVYSKKAKIKTRLKQLAQSAA